MKREIIGPDAMLQHGTTDHLVVAFSSHAVHFTKRFDGDNLFRDRPEHILFLRDMSSLIYHGGVAGLSNSIDETAEFVTYISAKLGAERQSYYGSSSGGYAAILFGLLCGGDDVFTVNPTTFVSKDLGQKLSCPEHILLPLDNFQNHYAAKGQSVPYDDLAKEMRERDGKTPLICLHYAAQNTRDSINARHLSDFERVFAIPHSTDDHTFLPSTLAKRGTPLQHFGTPLERLEREYADMARPAPDHA